MKAFVTGGSGFIGSHVVRKLVERGYDVYALARSPVSAAKLAELGATVTPGDVTDMASMREGMEGSDVVFHLAAAYEIGARDWQRLDTVNVGGTRKVLRLAQQLGVERIVYASTINVYGPRGSMQVDEDSFYEGPFRTEYDRTKWLAHYKVALPLQERGVPLIIVVPGAVYGPGDHSVLAELMRLFYRGFPLLPGPDTTITFAHVEDIAEGIVLAAEKGRVGETYILTGPAVALGEMFDFWAHLTGKSAPPLRLPSFLLHATAPLLELVQPLTDLESAFSREGAIMLGAHYAGRSDKAREELGWTTRPLQTGMLETFEWIAASEAERQPQIAQQRRQQIAAIALLTSLLLLVAWLFGKRHSSGRAEQ